MRIEYARSFEKDIKRLRDRKLKTRLEAILLALESASRLDEIAGVVAMSGAPEYFRIRIGQYRLGLKRAADGSILVLRFLTRGEIYRYFPK